MLFLASKLNRDNIFSTSYSSIESNTYFQFFYYLFIGCALYTTSFLPYGRFFNRVGGNWGFLGAYFFVFFYLGFKGFRRSLLWELLVNYSYIISSFIMGLFKIPNVWLIKI